MGNPEIKFFIENSSGKWTKFKVDTVEYVIKFDVKEEGATLQSIDCSLSDYQTIWFETITSDEFIDRLKRCNPLLACKELMNRIIWTVTRIPQNGDNVQITALNDTDYQQLSTKYYLSDGSDPIPLKFYWSLGKGSARYIYEFFNEMLMKISDLEKANDLLHETIRNKDQERDRISAEEKLHLNNSDSSAEMDGICHEGITCNNCEMDIFGHRYVCLECEDYDLCMNCEHKEMQHTHHIMVRYARPEDKLRAEELFRVFSQQPKQTAKRSRSARH